MNLYAPPRLSRQMGLRQDGLMRLGRYLIVGAALIAGGTGWLRQRTRIDLSRNENGGHVVQVRGFGELQDALAIP